MSSVKTFYSETLRNKITNTNNPDENELQQVILSIFDCVCKQDPDLSTKTTTSILSTD